MGSVTVNSGLAAQGGVRLIVHGPGTNTEGPHLHADLRTDMGHRYETGGNYTPLIPSPLLRMRVSSRGFDLFRDVTDCDRQGFGFRARSTRRMRLKWL